jgi:hypothetical protein
LLQAADGENWRRGRVGVLERRIRGNVSQTSEAMHYRTHFVMLAKKQT